MSTYKPLQPGIPAQLKPYVDYKEFYPRNKSSAYCFWTLQTRALLKDDFHYLILPDACVDIVFDIGQQPAFEGVLVMTPNTTASLLNLGRNFWYIGIRLLPGTWHEQPNDVVGQILPLDYLKNNDFRRTRQQLQTAMPDIRLSLLENLTASLEQRGVIGEAPYSPEFLHYKSVENYAQASGLSRRHFQRLFRKDFGYAPHDFIKITRFQQSLRQGSIEAYTDQSHFIRELKRITSLTPSEFQTLYR